jgi:hypothetical protein
VPRLRSPDRPGVPFSSYALPSPDDPSTPTEVGDDLRWTRARRPSRIASHERLRRPQRSSPTPRASGGVPDFKALLRRRVRNVPRSFPTGQRPILPWALFPSKVLQLPPPRRPGRLPRLRRDVARSWNERPGPSRPTLRPVVRSSLPRFTDATSGTSIEIEKVPRESVRIQESRDLHGSLLGFARPESRSPAGIPTGSSPTFMGLLTSKTAPRSVLLGLHRQRLWRVHRFE